MKFLNKMERKYGRFAIKNLTMYIILTYIVGFALANFAPEILGYFLLEPYFILQGEVWRIISWVFVSQVTFDIWTIIMLFFYYSIGRELEQVWGDFRYNVYVFGGIFFVIIASFVLYFITGAQAPFVIAGEWFDTYYICLSLFFGYAMTCPNQYVLLYFIIPVKMKWMALISLLYIVVGLVKGTALMRAEIMAALLNFIIFFGLTRGFKSLIKQVTKKPINYRPTISRPIPTDTSTHTGNVLSHRCAVCGRTEKDGENLEFRYCSKCEGDYEYCQDHLFTHEHVKRK